MKASRRGLDLLLRPERFEALLWTRLRFENRQDAREPLFNRYRKFARSVALRLRPWGQSANLQDAEQWAYSGLLQAIDAFDPLRGAAFTSFARPRIIGSVRDGFSSAGEIEAQWKHERRQKSERLRSLKTQSAADSQDAVEALGAIAACVAIGLLLDGSRLIADGETADPGANAYDSLAWRQTQIRLEQEIGRLGSSEETVIRQHYLNGLAFAQIADLMGLSRGRISQIHSSALCKLRKRIPREF